MGYFMNFPKISLNFIWFDLWVGFFWDHPKKILYIGPLPTIIIKVDFGSMIRRRAIDQFLAEYKSFEFDDEPTARDAPSSYCLGLKDDSPLDDMAYLDQDTLEVWVVENGRWINKGKAV